MIFSDVEATFKTIQNRIGILESQNGRLDEENKRLKNEHYKDDELSEMKDKLDKMQRAYYRSFPISDEEKKKIEEWKDRHDEEVHNAHSLIDKVKLGGCCGGRYTYEFIPMGIGTIGTIKCSCGAEFTFQNMV